MRRCAPHRLKPYEKGRGSEAAAPGLEPCAHERIGQRRLVVSVRRLYRQLLATSCLTSRGAAPIWNSPISRYKEHLSNCRE